MNYPMQLRSNVEPVDSYEAEMQPQESMFKRIHALLRGRYRWAIPLGLVLGVLAALVGYKATRPEWTSTAAVRLRSVLPVVVAPTPENQQQASDYVKATQIALLKSQRVLEMAMLSEDWKATGRGFTDASIAAFTRQLSVTSDGRSEIITVSFTDGDPNVAQRGVRSVINAYRVLCIEGDIQGEENKKMILENRRTTQRGDIARIRETIAAIASKHIGTDNLRGVHTEMLARIALLEKSLMETRIELASMPVPTTQAAPERKLPAEMTVSEIAALDPKLAELVFASEDAQAELDSSLSRRGENHPSIQVIRDQVVRRQRAVDSYVRAWHAQNDKTTEPMQLVNSTQSRRAEAELKIQQYEQLLVRAKEEAIEVGRSMLEIERFQREKEDLEVLLAQTNKRLDELRTEFQDRINVISDGDRPMMTRDNRFRLAAVGGVGGMSMGIALFILLGLLDRRMRSPEDALGKHRLGLLGVIPDLPPDLNDPEVAGLAAHCVHQIRTRLQIGSDKHVFAVTSPISGTGKTSLVMSLGLSFAASNCRTLLIDCDLIGRGLTARAEAVVRRKIGQILIRQGLIDESRLQLALKLAAASQKQLGQVLVDLGYLSEAQLHSALHLQSETPLGVLDALMGHPLEECVTEVGAEGLSILPIGSALPMDVSKLAPNSIRSLLEQARARYDVVLVDTGPVPGSLEASVVAASSDAVLLVVSRGEHRAMAERSVQHLNEIGARIAGMVFNRTDARDVQLSSTASAFSSRDRSQNPSADLQAGGESRMGPMASAMNGPRGGV